MNWLISPAYAQTGGAAPGGAPGGVELIMLVVMMVVFYFFLIRPQQKRAKEHKNLVKSLNKGDEVVTSGGILGKIVKVTDDFVVVEISNNLEIKLQKQSVQATLPKGTIKNI
ncbi:preprotein translocase subunit YajC [Alloalcanivorax mobilis]|uniref:preprotein translocase subunit YajC n=1 Tax=Alloalcanivorax mobilis TaxID=2019569 RepID=UPI000B5B1EF8|nr:preprotein translocase subunit YajC [Alloalcanivorax mobilis]ASK35001.1 preprotein translocase subunit YajC [Alcanivorax sp. N3-2A]|tara:strand:- start:13866 stop:14201 length:336 start_codon:yes stop_codon:yes gene_type:complete